MDGLGLCYEHFEIDSVGEGRWSNIFYENMNEMISYKTVIKVLSAYCISYVLFLAPTELLDCYNSSAICMAVGYGFKKCGAMIWNNDLVL